MSVMADDRLNQKVVAMAKSSVKALIRKAITTVMLALGLSTPAFAVPTLSLSITGGTSPLVINSTPDLDLSYVGTYATANGIYRLIVGGSADDTNLTLTVLVSQVTNTPNPITFALTETDFVAPPSGKVTLSTSSTSNLSTASQTSFRSYFNPSNSLYGQEQLIGSVDRVGPNNFIYGPVSTFEAVTSPYSLTLVRTLTPVAGAHPQLTAETDIANLPEPTSLMMLEGGMLLLLGLRRGSKT